MKRFKSEKIKKEHDELSAMTVSREGEFVSKLTEKLSKNMGAIQEKEKIEHGVDNKNIGIICNTVRSVMSSEKNIREVKIFLNNYFSHLFETGPSASVTYKTTLTAIEELIGEFEAEQDQHYNNNEIIDFFDDLKAKFENKD